MSAGISEAVPELQRALLAALDAALASDARQGVRRAEDGAPRPATERRSADRPRAAAAPLGEAAGPPRLALLSRGRSPGPCPLADGLRRRALAAGALVIEVACGSSGDPAPHEAARALVTALARDGDPEGALEALLARLEAPTDDPAAEARRRTGHVVRALTDRALVRPVLLLADGLEGASEEAIELFTALVRATQAPEGAPPALFLALSARRGGEAAFAALAREAGGPRGALEVDAPAPESSDGQDARVRPPAPTSQRAEADAARALAQAAPRTARRILRAALAGAPALRGKSSRGKPARAKTPPAQAPDGGLQALLGRASLALALDLPASAPERRILAAEAAAALEEARTLAVRRGDRAEEARLSLEAGRAHRLAFRDEPSRAALARALDLAEADGAPRLQALVHGARAEAALGKGASAAAVSLAERAAERLEKVHAAAPAAERTSLALELSQAEAIRARALLAAGDPERTAHHARKALAWAQEARDPGAALEAHLSLADAALALARRDARASPAEAAWAHALAAASDAVQAARVSGDARALSRALERRAHALADGGAWEALRTAHLDALSAARRTGERHRIARALAGLARISLERGLAEAAVTAANEAATLENPLSGGRAQAPSTSADTASDDERDPGLARRGVSYARALLLLGRGHLAAGRPERSLACAARARALAGKAQDASLLAPADLLLADARALAGALGDPAAVQAWDEANSPQPQVSAPLPASESVTRQEVAASQAPPSSPSAPPPEAASLSRWRYARIVGRSEPMERLYALLDRIGDSPAPVLVSGESGTGKELVARSIHEGGARRSAPFLSLNCAALPEPLLESELFGHVKGAFTGADADKMGLFEAAGHGTLFLDEVGEMSPGMQVKLLRVLQEREVRRVGGTGHVRVEARIIAASNRDLARMTDEGRFRPDLFYRLNVISVALPPLRERREDIPLLVEHFLRRLGAERCAPPTELAPGVLEVLTAAPWPGNIRELENEIRRAVTLAHGAIAITDLSPRLQGLAAREAAPAPDGERGGLTLRERIEIVERRFLKDALARSGGNKTRTAQELGLSRFGLLKKLDKYGLR